MGLKDERGMMAIGVALMLIVVLALFGGVLWQYSMAEMRRVERAEHDMQALFLARAGAEAVMAAWLEEGHAKKPIGQMDRIYYDAGAGLFGTDKPSNYLGYVDVLIRPALEEHEEDLTEFIATASVGNYSKTIRVKTFPHQLGHENPLNWYDDASGQIALRDTTADELVVINTKKPSDQIGNGSPIHLAQGVQPNHVGFSAPVLYFKSPLDLSYNQERGWQRESSWLKSNINYKLPISADLIFFQDLTFMYLPDKAMWGEEEESTRYSIKNRVVLNLGPGSKEAGETHGKVYFDGNVQLQKMAWEREERTGGFLWWTYTYYVYRIAKDGEPIEITNSDGTKLKGNAFFFKNGTNLAELTAGDLVLIDAGESRANELKGLKPFIYE